MTSNTKIIIYDDTCPMCAAYTSAFVHAGMIDTAGRKNFNSIEPELLAVLDVKRSVNEIPLIDNNTKQVWYGIDALLEIIGQRLPFIKTVGNCKPVKWVLNKLYRLISYNRRVIVAARQPVDNFNCTPDFNFRYRISFLVIFLICNTMMLFPLHQYLLSASLFKTTSALQLQWAHFTVVSINILLALQMGKKKGVEYLGQVNMLALTAILLTVPAIEINKYFNFHSIAGNSFYIGILTAFVIIEYFRRMKFAGIIPGYLPVAFINIGSIAIMLLYLIM